MELSIIIVSFNTSELLRKCLNKIYKSLSFGKIEKESEVIVVDNASSDDSVSMVKKSFPKVITIQNGKNFGFSVANNQGIKKSSGKYILLLNSDTEIREDALVKLLDNIKSNEKIGVIGGKLFNKDGTFQPSGGFFPSLAKIFFWMFFIDDIPYLSRILKPYHVEEKSFYEKPQVVDWVSGACFLLRRTIIEKVGFLDENIFMYGEELEWCYRIKKGGFQIKYIPDAKILHHKGASGKKEEGIISEFKAILYLYKKHKPSWELPIVRLLLIFGALLRIVVFGIISRYPLRKSYYAKAIRLVRQ